MAINKNISQLTHCLKIFKLLNDAPQILNSMCAFKILKPVSVFWYRLFNVNFNLHLTFPEKYSKFGFNKLS